MTARKTQAPKDQEAADKAQGSQEIDLAGQRRTLDNLAETLAEHDDPLPAVAHRLAGGAAICGDFLRAGPDVAHLAPRVGRGQRAASCAVWGVGGADGDTHGRAAACAADGGELVELGVGGPEVDVHGANHPAPGWSP